MEEILPIYFNKYYRKYDSDRKLREHIGTVQIPKFSVLIHDILENAFVDNLVENNLINKEKLISEFSKKIAELVHSISIIDNILDVNGKHEEHESILISHTCKFMKNVQNIIEFIENLGLKIDASLILLDINNLFNLLEKELMLKKGKKDFYEWNEILDFLKLTNSDFVLYTDLSLQLIKKDKREYIASFFEYYTMMDIIIDDMADIEDDYELGSSNALGILLNKDNIHVIDIAIGYGKSAIEIADKHHGHLPSYLKYLAEAELDALNTFKHNIDKISMNTMFKKFVLKPYSWEIYDIHDIQI
jgi:hypothetical protein